jgi:hypothetical protein
MTAFGSALRSVIEWFRTRLVAAKKADASKPVARERKPNKQAVWVEDLNFVFGECARVDKLIANTPPGGFKNLPRTDVTGDLPHPSGRGNMVCSMGCWLTSKA